MKSGLASLFFILLFKGIFAQVNIQTGAAEQSFPLINYADSKSGLTLGISANYSSGNGLIVNSLASNLGTGWTLDAGGMITRIQKGQPDDQPEYNNGHMYGDEALKRYAAGYLYNSGIGQGCPKNSEVYPVFKDENIVYKTKNSVAADLQQDVFVFSMNGRGGSFIIGKDWKPTTIGDSRVKITIDPPKDMTNQGIRTTIDRFTITTEDGIKYTFGEKALSQICRYKYSKFEAGKWKVENGKRPSDKAKAINLFYGYKIDPTVPDERPYTISSWYLSEIENTNNGEKILFEYDDVTHDIISSKYISHSKDLNGLAFQYRDVDDANRIGKHWYDLLSDPKQALSFSLDLSKLDKMAAVMAGPINITYLRSITKNKRIKRIVFPNQSEVVFIYDQLKRIDLINEELPGGDAALNQIDYKIGSRLIRSFRFENGYFFKNKIIGYRQLLSTFENKFARLCLLSIQKIGNGIDNVTEPPYKFSYHLGFGHLVDDIVPPRNSLSQDHWGYYNGLLSGLPVIEDHDHLSDPQNQYLKTVLFNYHELRPGLIINQDDLPGYAMNGLLTKVTYPTGGYLRYEYKQNRTMHPFPISQETVDGGVSVKKTILYDGENDNKNIITEYSYSFSNDKSSRWGYEQPSYTSLTHTVYDESWRRKRFKYPGIEYPELTVNSPSASFNWGKFLLNASIGYAVQTAASAVLPASVLSAYNTITLGFAIYNFISSSTEKRHFYQFVLTNSNDMLSNPVGGIYSRVEVKTNSPTGYNGKTVYEFTSPSDYPLLERENKWPYIPKQRAAGWAYGLLKKVTVLDKDNNPVSERQNDYKIYHEKIADNKNINCYCESAVKYSITSEKYAEQGGFTSYHNVYYSYTGRADLYSSYQKEYVNGNLYFSNHSSITTDPLTLLPKGEITKKDDNTLILKRAFYPKDYDLTGAIARLKTNNAIHTPVATETFLLNLQLIGPFPFFNITSYLIDANVTEYKEYTFNGKTVVKPWKTYALKAKTPILKGFGHTTTQLLDNPDQYKLTSEMFYDANGNLVQTKSDDQVSSFINDHSDRYVIASVANASYNDIAYTSFEANGTGNWNFSSGNIISASSVTGYKSYQLSSGAPITNVNTLSTSTNYFVTYWYKPSGGTASTVNGKTGELLFETADGWKLYKHSLNGTATVSISGNGQIDEVRLYPSNALMSTVSYNEGIGKINECDANNRLLFYEYDGLGRLSLIRDQNKNVIKTYEYNYKK